MKRTVCTLALVSASLMVLSGCGDSPGLLEPDVKDFSLSFDAVQYPIWAGQTIPVGSLWISNDSNYIYVTYELADDWMLTETHLHLADSLEDIPMTPSGIPIPGQFDYKTDHDPSVSSYTYTIDLSSYGFECGDSIVVAAHAAVEKWDEQSQEWLTETAWGGDQEGPGPRWWFYAAYVIQCGGGGGGQAGTETAMARMYDDPEDFTYPWEGHAWFTYLMHMPTEEQETFYFYAAQHYRVGEVYISRDGSTLYVDIGLDEGYELEDWEWHLNVQLEGYSGNPEFGNFNCNDYIIEGTASAEVPWDPEWDDQVLCIAVHGVVSGDYPEED